MFTERKCHISKIFFAQANDHEFVEFVGKAASKKVAVAMAAKLALEALAAKGWVSNVGNSNQKSLKKKRGALVRLATQAGIPEPIFLPAVQEPLSDRWKASIKVTFPAGVSVLVSSSCEVY